MSVYAFEHKLKFNLIDCCKCHAPFMMTADAIYRFKQSKDTFCCPYCGTTQGWFNDSEVDVLKRKLDAERRGKELAQRQAKNAINKARAEKAAKTRIKNRIKNGVCPCCNRTFANLHAHMKKQHPDYVKD